MITATDNTEFQRLVTARMAVNYPNKKRILELPCGDGYRIRIGRERGHKVYGYSNMDLSTAWRFHGVDPYINLGRTFTSFPYPDNVFDLVMMPVSIPLPGTMTQNQSYLPRVIREMIRVGNEDFYFKFDVQGSGIPFEWWPKTLIDLGVFIQSIHKCTVQGNILIEGVKVT